MLLFSTEQLKSAIAATSQSGPQQNHRDYSGFCNMKCLRIKVLGPVIQRPMLKANLGLL